jgi:serine/threonine protein kinase
MIENRNNYKTQAQARRSNPQVPSFEVSDVNASISEKIEPIKKGRFQIFLVRSIDYPTPMAMKVFPHIDGNIHPSFHREVRSSSLSHPNILSVEEAHGNKKMMIDNKLTDVSTVMMEWAPHGDFLTLLKRKKLSDDEKVVRTYFRQLIEGVEHLQSKGMAHLDLKLENLLMGKDFLLKLIDFEFSCFIEKGIENGRGTPNFRAPEVRQAKCTDPGAADIFSCGILLFVLRFGDLPYLEDHIVKDHNFFELLMDNPVAYWEALSELTGWSMGEKDGFKELFQSCVKSNPKERATIADIKKSKWYNGSFYSAKELPGVMQRMLYQHNKLWGKELYSNTSSGS